MRQLPCTDARKTSLHYLFFALQVTYFTNKLLCRCVQGSMDVMAQWDNILMVKLKWSLREKKPKKTKNTSTVKPPPSWICFEKKKKKKTLADCWILPSAQEWFQRRVGTCCFMLSLTLWHVVHPPCAQPFAFVPDGQLEIWLLHAEQPPTHWLQPLPHVERVPVTILILYTSFKVFVTELQAALCP